MDLKEYSIEALENELNRRCTVPFPGMFVEDDNDLREMLCKYIDYLASDDHHVDNDWEHYIHECVMETYFSKDIWAWKKEITK